MPVNYPAFFRPPSNKKYIPRLTIKVTKGTFNLCRGSSCYAYRGE